MMFLLGGINLDVDCIIKVVKSRDKKFLFCSEGWKFGGVKWD